MSRSWYLLVVALIFFPNKCVIVMMSSSSFPVTRHLIVLRPGYIGGSCGKFLNKRQNSYIFKKGIIKNVINGALLFLTICGTRGLAISKINTDFHRPNHFNKFHLGLIMLLVNPFKLLPEVPGTLLHR